MSSYGGYTYGSRYDVITKGQIGANPGGKSGCDGCSRTVQLYGYYYSYDSYGLSFLILSAIALVLTFVSFGGFPVFRKWSAQVTTGLNRYGVKTFLLALAALAIKFILDIASSATYHSDRQITRSFYLLGWFQQFFTYAGVTLLLLAIARFIRGQGAHAGRSIVQIVVFGLVVAAALANLAGYIAYLAWYINIPIDEDYYSDVTSTVRYAPDVTDYINYLGYVYYVTDLVFWIAYILAATYTTIAFFLNSRAFKILSVLTTLLAIGLLVLQAILNLAGEAMSIWIYRTNQTYYYSSSSYDDYYSSSYYTTRENLYLYLRTAPGVENILVGLACPVLVLAVYFAARYRVATTEKV